MSELTQIPAEEEYITDRPEHDGNNRPITPAVPDPLVRPLASLMLLDWEKVAYGLFILIALVTRLWGVGDRVMSHDESLHTQFSYNYYKGQGYSHTPLMHGPSLFHITALSYWLFGANDFTSRLPVALVGVFLVVMPYFFRPWIGRIGAIAASFFLLISPFITYYSRYIRHDIYLITSAVIVFTATWYYLRYRQEKSLWLFAVGLALMFVTMEASFIYVAIFGSFLLVRVAVQIFDAPWLRAGRSQLVRPAVVLFVALLLLGIGFVGTRLGSADPAGTPEATATDDGQGFAADPEEDISTGATAGQASLFRWLTVVGLVGAGLAVVMAARAFRLHLETLPEFDLVVLYGTLILPALSPLLTVLAGYDPQNYSTIPCPPFNAELSSSGQLMTCLQTIAQWPVLRTSFFLALTLVIAVLVGLWWNRRRWLIAAVIFHTIFTLFFTSLFTNPGGWGSGMIGSLGYWLAQQEVQRGGQPWFYYFFMVPFYEFLPLIFSLLAVRHWSQRHRLNKVVGYWLGLLLACILVYSLGNWIINRPAVLAGQPTSNLMGLVLALVLLLLGILYWFFSYNRKLKAEYDLGRSWRDLVDRRELVGFVPQLVWWLALTWVAYSIAGEKMPWLSSHFVFPMALLSGWYIGQRIHRVGLRNLLNRPAVVYTGLGVLFIVALFLLAQPLILGQLRLGDQQLQNLRTMGRFLGYVAVAGGLFYLLWRYGRAHLDAPVRRLTLVFSLFILLAVLTMRFTYLSSWPNADYAREFMVYAHAAPAVKEVVMPRLEELSRRMYGDMSMVVAWDNDTTWPMQWYLKDFPNKRYYDRNPDRSITEAPVVLAGSVNWGAVEPVLGDDYTATTYTFIWWPLEDYRRFSWNALFGVADWPETPEQPWPSPRGLASPEVRRALWDIFFYRDYTNFGRVFDKEEGVTAGRWELRHDLRVYIRNDVLANLWDYGVTAASIEPPVDPYEEGELSLVPTLVVGTAGAGEGQLQSPRNVALGPDGNLYVADSGNHRIMVFDPAGSFLRTWGRFGTQPGEFNEPWSVAVDEEFVYVADTWNHRLQKFTLDGEVVATIGQSGNVMDLGAESGGYFFGPRDLLLLDDNRLAVTDTGNHRIQVFDRDGNFLQSIGQQGGLPGQFNEPVGLALSPAGDIYLADTWNGRIQRFDPDFFPSLEWAVDAWSGNSTNNKPYMAVDSDGKVYVTDPENFRVLIFNADGEYLARFGHYSTNLDGFGLPNGLAIDEDNNLYVVDAANGRILKFALGDVPELGLPAGDVEDIED